MSTMMSRNEISDLVAERDRARTAVKNERKKRETALDTGIRTAITMGTSFGLGLVNGKTGRSPEILGASLELVTGVVPHVAAFFVDGELSKHLHTVGDAGLACWTYAEGLGAGAAWKKKSPGAKSSGISDDELARAAAAAAAQGGT